MPIKDVPALGAEPVLILSEAGTTTADGHAMSPAVLQHALQRAERQYRDRHRGRDPAGRIALVCSGATRAWRLGPYLAAAASVGWERPCLSATVAGARSACIPLHLLDVSHTDSTSEVSLKDGKKSCDELLGEAALIARGVGRVGVTVDWLSINLPSPFDDLPGDAGGP